MLDQLLGLVLFGLGLSNPTKPAVKGDSTAVVLSQSDSQEEDTSGASGASSSSGNSSDDDDDDAQDSSGATGSQSDDDKDDSKSGSTIKPTKSLEKKEYLSRKEVLENIREREKKLKEVFDARKAHQKEELEQNQARAKLNTDTARKVFSEKLSKLKDTKKKTIAASLDLKIGEHNKKRTTIMLAFVSKMQEILDKISTRAAEAQKAGKDIAKVDSAVSSAQGAVASALTAITTQAGKTYVATVTSDETLKSDMEAVMKSLKSDLDAVTTLINSAKKAVYLAHAELAKVMEEPVTTPTVTTTP